MTTTTLVSGATGFLGARVVSELGRRGVHVRTLSRRRAPGVRDARVGDITNPSSLSGVCDGIDTIVHCAGFAHAQDDGNPDFEARHFSVNYEGTRALLDVASGAGVKRFVFLSSVKAIRNSFERQADEDFPGEPDSAYGRAKRAAEEAVLTATDKQGMEAVILRPAMVYGAGDRGNLARMVRGIRSGWFPALPETGNRRSLVHVDDLIEAILLTTTHEAAPGNTFIVASEEAPSGAQLYDAIRRALGMRPARWRFPAAALRAAGAIGSRVQCTTGKSFPLTSESVGRLLNSAWYSPARIHRVLGWQARVPLCRGLADYLDAQAFPTPSKQPSV